jgi:predicted ATPase
MSIEAIYAENFKGIDEWTSIDLMPLTIFFGANSSGKSTCIHACAALSQSLKTTNNNKPLVLDDEYSQVHLGRYIDVVHERGYKRSLKLGVKLPTNLGGFNFELQRCV